jgi:hypothetical protein
MEGSMMKTLAGPVLAAVAFHAALLAGYVAAKGGDPAVLVCVGEERMGHGPYEIIRTGFERFGYDGQFYFALAQSPWRRHDAGIDFAPGRQMRILYPALSWLLTGGNAGRLLWVMPAVNLLAIGALAALGALVARRQGLSAWWGCLLPLAVNVGMPALRNLTDVLSILAVCGLLAGWLFRGPWWQLGLWAAAAAFCREQNIAVVGVVLAAAAWQRQGRTCTALAGVLGLWAVWAGALRLMYGTSPFLPTQGNFGPPLEAYLQCWPHLGAHGVTGNAVVHAAALAFVGVQAVLALYLAVRRPGDPVLRLLLLAAVTLAVLGGPSLYEDKWSFTRVLAWLPLSLWLACAWTWRRWALAALALPGLLPLGVVLKAWVGAA